jgi:hypothetical protein
MIAKCHYCLKEIEITPEIRLQNDKWADMDSSLIKNHEDMSLFCSEECFDKHEGN